MSRLSTGCASTPQPCTVAAVVKAFLARADLFVDLSRQYGSPLYVIEEAILLARAREFTEAFRAQVPDVRVFFPLKTNSHPHVVAATRKAGLGIEVSSGLELEMALSSGAEEILFNGPAKTYEELGLAIRNHKRVVVILDSATELERLESLAANSRTAIRAGVRLAVETANLWQKFGIPFSDLEGFIGRARRSPFVNVIGLHFHTSWNMNPSAQVQTLIALGRVLGGLTPEARRGIEFIDIGGGFWPPQGNWVPTDNHPPFFTTEPSAPITEFARDIGNALRSHVFPYVESKIYAEPGRWICNDAMHIVLTVLDLKGSNIAVTDGATNAVGWERFEHEYFPVINLTQPEPVERPFLVLGSLCTPHDLWGRSYFGAGILRGDVLLIPMQGAYTYSLRQQFIKPLPRTILVRDGSVTADEAEFRKRVRRWR